jgi:D-3-phosphoglycerate dehydrogenase
MKKVILATGTNFSLYCMKAKLLLEKEGFEVRENTLGRPLTFDDLKDKAAGVGAVIAGVDVWNEELLGLARDLKIIARFGIGVDNIDLAAAKRHGVKVTNARGVSADSVAETVIVLILGLYRKFIGLNASVRQGEWERFMGHTIRGKKAGLIGFGAIAQYTAKLLAAFGAEVYAYDLYPDKEAAEKYGVTLSGTDWIIKNCDIISLHVPGTADTIKMINAEKIGQMKKSAILINTARGAVVDENALYKALKAGKIAGAGLDVFEKEPTDASNPLFALDNVAVLPHTAAETYEAYERVSLAAAECILDTFAGREPKNLLNP